MKHSLLLLAVAAVLAGCSIGSHDGPSSFPTSPNFKGKITMVVSEPHQHSDEIRTYQYDLDAGILELKQVKESSDGKVEIQRFATGGVTCYNSPPLQSPDGKLVAHCEGPFPGLPRGTQADFIVVEDMSGKQIYKQAVWYSFRIIGYAWGPDSRSIAVAESYSSTSLRPLDLLAALGGHPIPVYEFYVHLLRIDGSKPEWTLPYVREGSRLGFGMLTGWN